MLGVLLHIDSRIGRMARPDEPQRLTLFEALIPVTGLIVLVALSYYLFGDAAASGPGQIALVMAAMIAVIVAWRRGYSLNSLRAAAVESVGSGMGAIFILLAVGSLIGTWALSGTLLAMVYYGLQLLSPSYFYMTAALICAVISTGIGSSWTTVGTIGLGLMGISDNMGLDPAITAAAVISGAYFGDTASPLSDSANLAAGVTGVDLYQHLRETVLTSAVALAAALIVFSLLGRPGSFDASEKIASIEAYFHMSPLLFLPLAIVIALALFKVPPFTTIFTGALAGGVLAVFVAPERLVAFAGGEETIPRSLALLKGVWLALASGYESTTSYPAINQLVSRGGMASMLDTVWLIIVALAFGGIAERAGILDRLITPIINAARSVGTLLASLVATVVGTNIITADQYISIVLPARAFRSGFARRGLAPVVLSRAVGATGTPTSALIPWNSCGAYMAATLGVATLSYAPYAIFNFVSPLLVIVLAFTGIRMPRAPAAAEDESTAPPASAPQPRL
jgi:NhaC family Na+:H+ antiporter